MSLFYQPKYVFDTGPLIKMSDYPVDVFPTVWAKLNDLFIAKEAISCGEVLNELTNNVHGEDAIGKWAKKNKRFFLAPEPNELHLVREILKKFPLLVSEDVFLSTKPQADPFVIALALAKGCVLVHGEKFKPNAPKIPNVCKHFDVKEMSLHDFFRAQGWVF